MSQERDSKYNFRLSGGEEELHKSSKPRSKITSKRSYLEQDAKHTSPKPKSKNTSKWSNLKQDAMKFKMLAELADLKFKQAVLEDEIESMNDDKTSISSNLEHVQNWVNDLDLNKMDDFKRSDKKSHSGNGDVKDLKGTLKDSESNNETKDQVSKFIIRSSLNKELPIFSGEPRQWLVFIKEFKESTEICGFSKSENILRL